jgi:hypothetical protein
VSNTPFKVNSTVPVSGGGLYIGKYPSLGGKYEKGKRKMGEM